MIHLVSRKHPALHRPARRVEAEEIPSLNRLAESMVAYCKGGPGRAGLAAPQVGRSIALMVSREGQIVFNPTISVDPTDRLVLENEGCLSLPGRVYAVERFVRCYVEGMGPGGDPLAFEAYGRNARLWAHEGDHLDGNLVSDRWAEVSRR